MDRLVKFLGRMPCLPSELNFRYYVLPRLFGHMGIEEAAARLVSYSQVTGAWVGVSRDRFVSDIQKEIKDVAQATRDVTVEKCYYDEVDDGLNCYVRLLAISVGMTLFSVEAPKVQAYNAVFDMGKKPAIQHFSLIHTFGEKLVTDGLQILIDEKLVRVGKSGPSEGVLFPSPELVNKIMEKYKIS